MAHNENICAGRHVVYSLHAHLVFGTKLVFVTKYRRGMLSALALRDLEAIIAKVCKDFEVELIECNGEDDHVHLLIIYPPKVELSRWLTRSPDQLHAIKRKVDTGIRPMQTAHGPSVKAQKNDDRDAEAIAQAATRPTMRFAELKSEEQLDMQRLHRARDRLVGERTALTNQLRAILLERGTSSRRDGATSNGRSICDAGRRERPTCSWRLRMLVDDITGRMEDPRLAYRRLRYSRATRSITLRAALSSVSIKEWVF